MERCIQERHDRGGSERGQHDKKGRMEEEANQLEEDVVKESLFT